MPSHRSGSCLRSQLVTLDNKAPLLTGSALTAALTCRSRSSTGTARSAVGSSRDQQPSSTSRGAPKSTCCDKPYNPLPDPPDYAVDIQFLWRQCSLEPVRYRWWSCQRLADDVGWFAAVPRERQAERLERSRQAGHSWTAPSARCRLTTRIRRSTCTPGLLACRVSQFIDEELPAPHPRPLAARVLVHALRRCSGAVGNEG